MSCSCARGQMQPRERSCGSGREAPKLCQCAEQHRRQSRCCVTNEGLWVSLKISNTWHKWHCCLQPVQHSLLGKWGGVVMGTCCSVCPLSGIRRRVTADFPACERVCLVFLCAGTEIRTGVCKGDLVICTKTSDTSHPCLCWPNYGF